MSFLFSLFRHSVSSDSGSSPWYDFFIGKPMEYLSDIWCFAYHGGDWTGASFELVTRIIPICLIFTWTGYGIYRVIRSHIVSFDCPHKYYFYMKGPGGEVRIYAMKNRPFGHFRAVLHTRPSAGSDPTPPTYGRNHPSFMIHRPPTFSAGFGCEAEPFYLVYIGPRPIKDWWPGWDDLAYVYFPSAHGPVRFSRFLYTFLTGNKDPDVFKPQSPLVDPSDYLFSPEFFQCLVEAAEDSLPPLAVALGSALLLKGLFRLLLRSKI